MSLTRRQFVQCAAALALGGGLTQPSLAEPSLLKITDPGCPVGAFDKTREQLRAWQAAGGETSEAEKLRAGRAWLGGGPEFKPQLVKQGYWKEISTPDGPLKLRVLRPSGKLRGAVLAIHGGGWAVGAATSDEKQNWKLAKTAQVAVVSPEYRLAPEHPWPAGPLDCHRAARWLLANSEHEFGSQKLAITGGSAGAHLSVVTLLRLTPEERKRFVGASLFYGVYHLGRTKAWLKRAASDHPDLTPTDMTLYVNWFLPGTTDQIRAIGRYSPLRSKLPQLPPALFQVGSADLLARDTLEFARHWAASGNPAELVVYPGGPHGFNGYGLDLGLDPNRHSHQFLANLFR